MSRVNTFMHSPKQERSRQTADRILRAVENLLAVHGDFSAITVADIAKAAGTTTGGFYARFPSKEAVLIALFEDVVLVDARQWVVAALSPENCEGKTLREIIHAYLTQLVHLFKEHASVFRYIGLTIRLDRDFHQANDLVIQFNKEVTGALRARLMEYRDRIGHPQPEFALDLANLWSDFLLHNKICYGLTTIPFSHVNWVDDEAIVDELTSSFIAYLQVNEDA